MTNLPVLDLSYLRAERLRLLEELAPQDTTVTHGLGLAWCHEHTALCFQAIALAHRASFAPEDVAVIATGGFGRRETSPYSDADIAVIPAGDSGPELDDAVRIFFTLLGDVVERAFGVQISYSYRLISDLEGIDPVTRSSLLDSELIAGSDEIYELFEQTLEATHPKGEFLSAKLEERRVQMEKAHVSPLVAEPDLKFGAGGTRCFHTMNWIRMTLGEASLRPTPELNTLFVVRNLLQKITGKKSDLLNRTRQAEIADILQITPGELMMRVSSAMESTHDLYRDSIERIKQATFLISPGVHAVRGEVRAEPGLDAASAAIGIGLSTELGLHVPRFPLGTARSRSGSAFLHSIAMGLPTIRNLDRCGILKESLPELEACRYLQSDDSLHAYTVFEHTMQVVRHLDRQPTRSWIEEVKQEIADPGPLYLAALLHDVGKVDRARHHSDLGAELSVEICERLGVNKENSAMTTWLIKNHLAMTHVMRFRDLDQPSTISEFAALVESEEKLNYLTVLTQADIKAVASTTWTYAQETFLKQLYERTLELLISEAPLLSDVAVTRRQVLKLLSKDQGTEQEARELIDQLPAHYLASTPLDLVRIHTAYVRQARQGKTTIETFDRPEISGTDFTICAPDRPGLLSEVLGAMYAFDLSVPMIRACTTTGEPQVILDVITASYAGQIVPNGTRSQLSQALEDVLNQRVTAYDLLLNRGKDPNRVEKIISWTLREGTQSILEIRANRGRGLPYRLTRWITEQGWKIISSRLGQWAGKASMTFYIVNQDGSPVTRHQVQTLLP